MTIETVQDAFATAAVLYAGRDKYLLSKWVWWCKQLGPDKPFASITADDIDAGVQVLMTSPANIWRRGAGVLTTTKHRAPGTVNRYIAALGTLYRLLRTHRRIPRSFPAPSFKGLRLPEDEGRTVQVSIADVRKLVDAARLTKNKRLPALIAVACTSGLRKSNLQALPWSAVDLKARTLDVPRTKNGTPMRSVLPPWAVAELTRIRPADVDPQRLVFGKKDFRKAWESALRFAEIPGSEDWSFHSCRHIAASVLAQSGASLIEIMSCLNHKSPNMSLRYSHLNTKALDTAITKAWS